MGRNQNLLLLGLATLVAATGVYVLLRGGGEPAPGPSVPAPAPEGAERPSPVTPTAPVAPVPLPPKTPPGPVEAGIFGAVLDPDGNPAAGAEVEAFSGIATAAAVADAEGNFAVALDSAGSYSLTARAGEFAPGTVAGVVFVPGDRVTGIVLRLRPGAVVTGRVLGADGRPVIGATVRVLPAGATTDAWLGALLLARAPSAPSGEDGAFRIAGLPAGEFRLEAQAEGRAAAATGAFRIGEGESLSRDIVFPAGTPISGVVLDRRGAPVAGAKVGPAPQGAAALVPGFSGGPSATTGDDGAFALSGLTEPTDLRATKDGYAPATAPGVHPGQSGLRFVLGDLGSIAGRILVAGGGAPPEAPEIEARSAGAGFMGMAGFFPEGNVELLGEGRFRITALVAGEYGLTVFAGEFAPGRATGVAVREGEETSGVEIRLGAGETLRGLVVEAETGRPISGAAVTADLTGNPLLARAGQGRTRAAASGADGRFSLPGLPEGETSVTVVAAGYAKRQVESIRLPAEADLRVEMVKGGTVTVHLLRADGGPDLGKMVLLQRNLPFEQLQAMVGADGTARFENVPPGPWMVMRLDPRAIAESGLAGADLEIRTVEVANGTETVVRIQPGTGTAVRGAVTRGGRPVAGAMVFLTGQGEAGAALGGMKFGVTDADGRYELKDVAPGTYALAVSRPGNFVPAYSETLVVEGAEQSRDLRLPLGTAGGTVTDERGRGLAGVQLLAVPAAQADFRSGSLDESMRAFGGLVTSADGGSFRFDGLSPGGYVIRAWQEGRASAYSAEFEVPDIGDGPPDLRIELPAGVEVRVEVRGPGGSPVAEAWVFVTDPRQRMLALGMNQGARTDVSGTAVVRLAAGEYRVEVQAPGFAAANVPLRVGAGPETVRVELDAGSSLVVLVRDEAGSPVARARVLILDEAGRPIGRRMTGDVLTDGGDPTRTDEQGRLELGLVPAGDVTVRATADDGRLGEVRVRVAAGSAATATVTVRR